MKTAEKEMTTHSSVLAWRIPGTGKSGGLRLWGHTESDTTEATALYKLKQFYTGEKKLEGKCKAMCQYISEI